MLESFTNNWQGIVVATVAAMAIGSLWYSPLLFGNEWQRLAKLKDKDLKNSRVSATVLMLVMTFVSVYVLQRFLVISNPQTILEALKVGIWLWIGFVLTYTVAAGAFEKRPAKLTALNLANQLITMLISAAILYTIN